MTCESHRYTAMNFITLDSLNRDYLSRLRPEIRGSSIEKRPIGSDS